MEGCQEVELGGTADQHCAYHPCGRRTFGAFRANSTKKGEGRGKGRSCLSVFFGFSLVFSGFSLVFSGFSFGFLLFSSVKNYKKTVRKL